MSARGFGRTGSPTAVRAAPPTAPASPQGDGGADGSVRSGRVRVLSSAFVGTTIEWYDFYLYGLAAALVFNTQFFPTSTPAGATIASFATLAVGVVMRPLGGVIAGHWGDRVGRKAQLVIALVLMGLASTLIGLLPTFDDWGWWAVAALVTLRCLQGISAGMEWGGAALISVEHAPVHRRGLFGSFTQVGSSAGMLLATGSFTLVQMFMTQEQFTSFGWRLPFLFSGVLVVVGLAIRWGIQDAPEFTERRETGAIAKAPVIEVLRTHPLPVAVTAGLRLGQTGIYYLVTVYLVSHLVRNGYDDEIALRSVLLASAIGLVTTPLWGWASDRFGRRPVSRFGYVLIGAASWAIFWVTDVGLVAWLPLVIVLTVNIAHDSVYGPQAAWFAEQFPVHLRYSGVNLGYQLGTVLGGGLAPFIAAVLLEVGGGEPWLIAAYLTVLVALSLWATVMARDPSSERSPR